MKHKRLLSLALVFLMLFSSCSDKSVKNSDTEKSESTSSETETEVETEAALNDNLPDTDLNGYEFRILVSNDKMEAFFYTDEMNGEVVNDAIRTAILNTEKRFGCKISALAQGATDESTYNTTIRSSITSNDNTFDVAEMHDTSAGSMSLENLFQNLRNINYLSFDTPWYPSNAIESLTVDGKLYLFSSAMSYKGLHQTRILYMNKTLFNNYGLNSPYEDVFNGTWTLDKLSSLTNGIYSDLNANGVKDENDLYGFTVHQWFDGWMDAFGLQTVKPDPDSVLTIGIGDERTYDIVDKMYNWLFSGKDAYICKLNPGDTLSESDIFTANRSLITYGEISSSYMKFRNSDIDYGMLPYPKFDENQENYISFYTDRFFVIPTTAQNTDNIGLMLEAMSAEGYRTVFPAYYEIALKGKYAQDNESVRILDIINNSRTMSFSYVYFSNPLKSIFGNLFGKKNPSADFASFYQSNIKAAEKNVNKLVKQFESLN